MYIRGIGASEELPGCGDDGADSLNLLVSLALPSCSFLLLLGGIATQCS